MQCPSLKNYIKKVWYIQGNIYFCFYLAVVKLNFPRILKLYKCLEECFFYFCSCVYLCICVFINLCILYLSLYQLHFGSPYETIGWHFCFLSFEYDCSEFSIYLYMNIYNIYLYIHIYNIYLCFHNAMPDSCLAADILWHHILI